jgi:hypothetical protein
MRGLLPTAGESPAGLDEYDAAPRAAACDVVQMLCKSPGTTVALTIYPSQQLAAVPRLRSAVGPGRTLRGGWRPRISPPASTVILVSFSSPAQCAYRPGRCLSNRAPALLGALRPPARRCEPGDRGDARRHEQAPEGSPYPRRSEPAAPALRARQVVAADGVCRMPASSSARLSSRDRLASRL